LIFCWTGRVGEREEEEEYFDFRCVICGNNTHYLEEKLVRLQKRAARVNLDCDFYTPSSTLFSDLKWMSFPERVIYMKAI